MKYRDAILKKLDNVDSSLNRLNLTLNQGDRDGSYTVIETLREQIEQIKGYIEAEGMTGNEG